MIGVIGTACIAKKEIEEAIPGVIFTSGKRSIEQQAEKMADNVVKNRNWIAETYRRSYASDMCQQWVERNPTAVKTKDVAAGVLSVLKTLTYTQLNALSKHIGGMAFDIKPGTESQRAIIATTVEKHGGKFLTSEGGLTIWHCEF